MYSKASLPGEGGGRGTGAIALGGNGEVVPVSQGVVAILPSPYALYGVHASTFLSVTKIILPSHAHIAIKILHVPLFLVLLSSFLTAWK